MKPSTSLKVTLLFHEVEPKKMGIWFRRVDKTQYGFLVTSECLVSRSESVAFGQKSRYFTDQNRPKGGQNEYCQIQK